MANFLQPELSIEQIVGMLLDDPLEQAARVDKYKRFYFGFQGVVHSDRQNEYLTEPGTGEPDSFMNICRLVVMTILDRLSILTDGTGIKPLNNESSEFAEYCTNVWVKYNLNSIQNEIHEFLLRDGEAAMFVELKDGHYIFTPNEVYDGDEGVIFHMAEEGKNSVDFAAKIWNVELTDEQGEQSEIVKRMNIYIPGFVHRYWASSGGENWVPLTEQEVANETYDEIRVNPQPLPFEDLPLVRFYNNPLEPEFAIVKKIQELLNKSLTDIDIIADYHAYPLLTAERGLEENSVIGPGKAISGNNVKRIDPPEISKVWEGTVNKWLDIVSILKRWPLWLLNPQGYSVPSGTALKVAERPLTSQITKKQNDLDISWKEVFNLVRIYAPNAIEPKTFGENVSIRFSWEAPNTETVIEDREIEVRTANEAKIPYVTIWKQVYGFNDKQVQETQALLEKTLQYKQEQAEIMALLNSLLITPENAARFAGATDDQVLSLIQFTLEEFANARGDGTAISQNGA